MSEQIRGALFNTLGDIKNLTLLDTFAGSGAIGIEAVSRGASQAVLVESDKVAQRVTAENIRVLRLTSQVRLIRATVIGWMNTTDDQFDIVVADPPYHDTQIDTIEQLTDRVKVNGLLVLSWPGKVDLPIIDDCELELFRSYGDAQLGYYRRLR